MKKIYAFITILTSFIGYSQGITVDGTYTANQLVNQVLINSPCVSGTGVTSSTGTNFGSTNGIGYFENLNTNFPFSRGVVLTTGDVTKAPSPNNIVLSDGTAAWPGDADLEAALAAAGLTISSVNASYIEFNFVPRSSTFSFNFVFASEEYGTSQCNYSDAFAFLLSDNGGPNQNLAVLPSTNIPITVQTIRDMTYNSGCPSANPAYFGAYNGPGFGPAINFNGQTVLMTASASGLNTTHTYKIKIVIADGNNNTGYDSAIFLQANSFNLVQTLGPDYTVANGNASCPGGTLPTLALQGDPVGSGTTYAWKVDGVTQPSQTGATFDLNTITPALASGQHTISLTFVDTGCNPVTDDVIVEVLPQVQAPATVPDLYKCNNAGPNYTFDFTGTTATIMAGLPASTQVAYFNSQIDADNNTPSIGNSATITSAQNNKEIFVRITGPNGCYTTRSFFLKLVTPPTIVPPTAITKCARNTTDNPPRGIFDGTVFINQALNGQDQAIYELTLHTTAAGASNPANNTTSVITLPNPSSFSSPTTTVYIRIQVKGNPDCFVTSSVQLNVLPLPQVDIFPDRLFCTSYTLPALTYANSEYRTAPNGGGTVVAPATVITSTTTLYVYNNNGTCFAEDSFKLTKVNLPTVTPASATYCTKYTLPSLTYGNYFSSPGGVGPIAVGTDITTAGPTTLYVRYTDPTEPCTVEQPFTITIIPFTALPTYTNKFACSSYTLPANTDGGTYYSGPNKGLPIIPANTVYNTPNTYTVYVYKETGTTPNCTSEQSFTITIGVGNYPVPANVTECSSYTLPPLLAGEYRTAPAGGGTVLATGSAVTTSQTIYQYVPGQSCTDNLSFNVTIQLTPLPAIPDVGPVCDIYYLPSVAHTGNYYTGPGGTGSMRPVGYPITSTQTLYFFDALSSNPSCFVEEQFIVNIDSSPLIDARPVEEIRCNTNYVLPDLVNGEYYANPGGPSSTNPILPPGTPINSNQTVWIYNANTSGTCFQEYSVDIVIVNTQVNDIADVDACDHYLLPAIVGPGTYYKLSGGPNVSGQVSYPVGYDVLGTQTFYVYAEDNNRVACSDEDAFTVTLHTTPVVAPIASVTACDSYVLPAPIAPATVYYKLSGGPATPGNTTVSGTITTSQTIYAYASSGPSNLCFDEEPFAITINNSPVVAAISPVDACDNYTLPAVTTFSPQATQYVTTNDGTDVAYTNPTVGSSTTLYVMSETGTTPNCKTYTPLVINIYTTPIVAPIAPVNACDSYTLPAPVAPATVYYKLSGGPATPGNTTVSGTVTTSQTVYAYASAGPSDLCFSEQPMVINISTTPVLQTFNNIFACDSYTLPALTTGNYFYDAAHTSPITNLTLTTTTPVYVYAESPTNAACNAQANFTVSITNTPVFTAAESADVNACNSYFLPALTTPNAEYRDAPNGGGNVIPVNTEILASQLIYVRAVNGTAPDTCTHEEDKQITIFNVDNLPNVAVCGQYPLPTLTTPGAQYYTLPNGGGTPIPAGTLISSTQVFYIFANAPFTPACSDESTFTVTINGTPTVNPVPASMTTVCDLDGVNDGVTGFDLDSITPTILGTQNPATYSVAYFETIQDAAINNAPIVTDNGPLADTDLGSFYVKVSNISTPDCNEIKQITILVVPKPESDPLTGTVCIDSGTGEITPATVISGYSASLYNFNWTDANGTTVSTAPNFQTTTPGTYQLVITSSVNGLTGCDSAPIPVTIIESGKPLDVTFVTNGWFTNQQTVTVTATPIAGTVGNFVYALDGGTPQASNVFTGLNEGPHEISVIDVNGCGSAAVPIPVQLVYSMKFFSPNGDGINDTWKIAGLDNTNSSKLIIFDRYGRLLKQLTPGTDGWDGTINGTPLPADDYWFSVQYVENGVAKEYKSHFSLVR